ncbi:hypothetical protein Val02_35380 [Virgisporangium aliadipatigenens]|uniref:Uncharacterized protein n=1 Tax=Virgisporangium aliadipatigenens TaxID=741659 RepID=A0A8J3YLK7_9ACTN|nr:hypothetical protein Val02_35380 [Virgisporangium aliadipatigenens]
MPRPARLAAAFAAAWIGPLLTHLVKLDFLLPVIVLALLMAVQRGVAGVLDRLVLALGQAFGALCVAGLLFSVWPWGLHPVPIAGVALSVLVALVAVTRPAWRTIYRPGARDLLAGAAALGVAGAAAVPFALRDLGGRIGIIAAGEDMARHIVLTDIIGQAGGYAFLHRDVADRFLSADVASGISNYPQGTYLTYAVLDRFVRSSDRNTDAITQASHVLWLYVATFAFLGLAVLWAVRRVAGPGATPLRLAPVLAVAAAWVYCADPVAVFVRGYPNQLMGMALAAILTGLVVRPLTHRGAQGITVALLVVGVSFSYHLFLPYAGVAALVWALRTGAWRHPGVVAAGVVAAPFTLITPILNLNAATAEHLGTAGTALPVDRPLTALLVLLALMATTARRGLRSPAFLRGLMALGAALTVALGLAVVQLVTVGSTVYYFEKTLHLAIIVALVLLGGLVRLVPRRTVPALACAVPLLLVIAATGGQWHTRPGATGLRLLAGIDRGSPAGGSDAVYLARQHPRSGEAVTVDLMSTPYRNWLGTLYASSLTRNYRYGHAWYAFLNPANPPKTLDDLDAIVAQSPVPVRFYVANAKASMLVLDPARPARESDKPGGDPVQFGAAGALTNIEAAEYLAARYPGKVQVIHGKPPERV